MTVEAPAAAGRYAIVTYGCQMNDNDSEILAGILESRGFVRTGGEADADVVIVNTCVVREGAEERALGRLQAMKPLKTRNPEMVIAIAGCMAQKEGRTLLERVPHADLVVGTRDIFKIGHLVDEVRRTGERLLSIEDIDQPVFLDAQPVRRKSGLKGLVTIMYGCNNFCSFCIVPKTRGREVSRPLEEVRTEVQSLADLGYREVMLLGQNVNSYRHNGRDFADLLEAVDGITGIERVRFITSHPKDCTDRLIDAMAHLPKVCENIHLPVQAGSNRVLRRMKRFYTKDHYLDLLARLRERVPGVTVTTDLIAGFPDETDEDFEETYDLLERARWDSAFTFMYSPREGTKSAQWHDSVPLEAKRHRLQRLAGRQEQISGEVNAAMLGQTVEVLVESVSRRSESEMMGRTRGDKCVIFAGEKSLLGQLAQVRVTDTHPHTLFGELTPAD